MAINGTAGEPVEEDAAEELWIRLRHFLDLRCDVPGKVNFELDGAGFPHKCCVHRC